MLYITTPNEPLCFLCVRPTIPHTNSLCPSFIASSLIIIPYTIYIYRAGHLLTCDKLKEKKNMNRRQDDDELNKKKLNNNNIIVCCLPLLSTRFWWKGLLGPFLLHRHNVNICRCRRRIFVNFWAQSLSPRWLYAPLFHALWPASVYARVWCIKTVPLLKSVL